MSKVDFALYEIQRDENGKYFINDQSFDEFFKFNTLTELINWIEKDLQEIEEELK